MKAMPTKAVIQPHTASQEKLLDAIIVTMPPSRQQEALRRLFWAVFDEVDPGVAWSTLEPISARSGGDGNAEG